MAERTRAAEFSRAVTSHHILVVDDDELVNQLFCEFLQSKGFATLSAYSMQGALAAMHNHTQVDLILLDYQLGDGDGLGFLAQINADESSQTPPVIMVSANEAPEFLEMCFARGVSDYLIKPVNLSLLALKVAALIRAVELQKVIRLQNAELEHFKQEAEREEAVAKFIYEYLLRQNDELMDGITIAMRPSRSFSGDIALAKFAPSGDLFFLLADATGHGLSAAITIMPVVSIFTSMVAKGFDVQSIAIEMNRKLLHDTPEDRFVAAALVHIRRGRNEICVWNGGIPVVVWIDQGEIQCEFTSRHMALGILEDDAFDAHVESWAMPASGSLLMCTDGLLEEPNLQGECFSRQRLDRLIAARPQSLISEIFAALDNHSAGQGYRDDVSVCLLSPADMVPGGVCSLDGLPVQSWYEDELSSFSWSVSLSGKKIAKCELSPLCNKFLQYVGISQYSCQMAFIVVSEMVHNAIDHGLLGLDSAIKAQPDGFTRYFHLCEQRLGQLQGSDQVELQLSLETTPEGAELAIVVKDTGPGWDYQGHTQVGDEHVYGRGLMLVRGLAKRLQIYPPGNHIRVVIPVDVGEYH